MKKLLILVIILLFVALLLAAFIYPGFLKTPSPDFSEISSICELSTLECYYHNVAKLESDGHSLLFFQYGNKKVWIEYSGIVTIGIDASEVLIDGPDSKGTVTVTMPDAEVLSTSVDKDSISEPLTETGLFASITAEDRIQAYSMAQIDMEETAKSDSALLKQGKERAKTIIANFIQNVGSQLGKEYTIVWKDAN